jgi:hypothetical protein
MARSHRDAGYFRKIRLEFPTLLKRLEERGDAEMHPGSHSDPAVQQAAARLRITSARQGATDYPGSIYMLPEIAMERVAAYHDDESGARLALWLSDFLASPRNRDVRDKLAKSGAAERHAFVVLPASTTAPAAVLSVFIDRSASPPAVPIALPAEVTGTWVVTTWATVTGLKWSAGGWSRFDTLQQT